MTIAPIKRVVTPQEVAHTSSRAEPNQNQNQSHTATVPERVTDGQIQTSIDTSKKRGRSRAIQTDRRTQRDTGNENVTERTAGDENVEERIRAMIHRDFGFSELKNNDVK